MNRLPFTIFFDSCGFYPPQASEKLATKKLLILWENSIINIIISYMCEKELSKAPPIVAKMRLTQIYTMPVTMIDNEKEIKKEIKNILFNNKAVLKNNDINDIGNIFEAQKYGCRLFVTLDKKHIISKKKEIYNRFGMKVVMPSECILEIIEYAKRRKIDLNSIY